MDDMSAKIQEILSDKESMKQLSELAQMFSSSSEESNENDTHEPQEASPENFMPDFDISMLFKIQDIMGKTKNDKTSEFLVALKPLLKEERREKLDRAIKILRLLSVWEILKESGLLNDLFKAGNW